MVILQHPSCEILYYEKVSFDAKLIRPYSTTIGCPKDKMALLPRPQHVSHVIVTYKS